MEFSQILAFDGETVFDKPPSTIGPCIVANCDGDKPDKLDCWTDDVTPFSSIENGLALGDGIGEVIFVGFDCDSKAPALRVFALQYDKGSWTPVMVSQPFTGGTAGGASWPWINTWPLAAGDVMGTAADEVFVNVSNPATETEPGVLVIWNVGSEGGTGTGFIVAEMRGPVADDPLDLQGAFGWAIAAADVAGSSHAEVVVGAPLLGSEATESPCKGDPGPKVLPPIALWGHAYLYLDLDVQDAICAIADWNGVDGVNSTDVSDFVNSYFVDLASCTPGPCTLFTDLDGNGIVNSTDATVFNNIWAECYTP